MKFILPVFVWASMLFAYPEPYSSLENIFPFDDSGWFCGDNRLMLEQFIQKKKIKIIVELGSLLGQSTRYMAERLPEGGVVYAVDHWLGNPEHQSPHRTDIYPKLPTLYERFLSNVIHARLCDKIIPVRMTTLEAAEYLAGIQPDLVYVDATHETHLVLQDLETWYPFVQGHGILCGDDWERGGGNGSVKVAVIHFANLHGLRYFNFGNFWWLEEY